MPSYISLILGLVFTLLALLNLSDYRQGYLRVSRNRGPGVRKVRFEEVFPKVQPLKTVYLILSVATLILGLSLLAAGLAPLF